MGNVLIGVLELAAKYLLPVAAIEALDRILPREMREHEMQDVEELRALTAMIRENNELFRAAMSIYYPQKKGHLQKVVEA